MNIRMIVKVLGTLLIVEAACMLPSLLVSLIYRQDDFSAFVVTILLLLLLGLIMYSIKATNTNLYTKDGFAIVSFGWILISLFGALPFFISGAIPHFIDAFFESVSGFTTTGSTILKEVENLPRGVLFWRSFTHWMGGMGVLVLMLAVLPKAGANTIQIMKAESPGPNPDKLVPKIGQTAKILYSIYLVLTVILVIMLLISGMPLYDSLIHALGTAGTGGFSNMNRSVGAYNNVFAEIIITIFMFIFGISFTLYYQALKGNWKVIFKDEEFRFYVGTMAAAIILMTINLTGTIFSSVWESLRHASFQAGSLMSTTGYATTDFNLWPTFSKVVLFFLMLIGGSAGSTAGGLKCIRIVLLFKIIKREVIKVIHPKSVFTVKVGGRALDEKIVSGVTSYLSAYMMIFATALLIVSLDGFDLITTFTSVATTISNVGPGFGLVGPLGSFTDYSVLSKIIFSLTMLFGRLEILPVLILFAPSFWKKVNI